jgi:hypothetical protein
MDSGNAMAFAIAHAVAAGSFLWLLCRLIGVFVPIPPARVSLSLLSNTKAARTLSKEKKRPAQIPGPRLLELESHTGRKNQEKAEHLLDSQEKTKE